MSREPYRPEPLGRCVRTSFGASTRMRSAPREPRRDEQREALSSKIDSARAAHRRHFKLRHHAIAAMPIPGREKHKLYKMLSFERKAAERRLTATIKRWRTMSVDTHPGSWKEFLAGRAARGDQRAIRRLRGRVAGVGDQEPREPTSGPAISQLADESGKHHSQPARRGTAPRVRRIDRAPRRGPR